MAIMLYINIYAFGLSYEKKFKEIVQNNSRIVIE